jgi:muramoyltetrapeptide carboxypeptidase
LDLPRALPEGGGVFVWAPSSPAPILYPRRFERGLGALREAGYRVTVGESCRNATGCSTLPPKALALELESALRSDACDAVIAAVGGWTTLPVLEFLDLELVAAAGKPIVGYSDLTGLLNAVAFRAGLVTFHGPMVLSEWGEYGGPWEYTRENFRRVVSERWQEELEIRPAEAWSDEVLFWDREDDRRRAPKTAGCGEQPRVLNCGTVEGRVWGGNLTVMGLLAGTRFWPPAEGAIVFLEAEGIAPDECWARLEQLRLAGTFEEAAGVVFGKFSNPRATAAGVADFDAVLREAVPEGLPVMAGADFGHTEPMCTLPIGAPARLTCGGEVPDLRLVGPVVA